VSRTRLMTRLEPLLAEAPCMVILAKSPFLQISFSKALKCESR